MAAKTADNISGNDGCTITPANAHSGKQLRSDPPALGG
jgi:hypothetical protein